jgi:hypothetical protein
MFFSTASEGDHDGVGIAEDAANGSGGVEPRERVQVAQPVEVGHADIVTGLAGLENTRIPAKTREFRRSQAENYPHYSPKSQKRLRTTIQGCHAWQS